MKKLLDLLKTFLIPIEGTSNEFCINPCKIEKNGFTAKYINHDVFNSDKLDELEVLLTNNDKTSSWVVKLFPESSIFDDKTGQKKTRPEKLWFGPETVFDTDKSDDIIDIFG